MASALYSFKVDADGQVRIGHIFFGKDDDEAWANLEKHADVCPKFGPAYQASETIEVETTIDEIPAANGAELEDFIGLDDEEEED
jgi:hypothetical protein